MYYYRIFFLFIISVNCQTIISDKCSDLVIQRLCIDQDICDQCLQAHPCCNWCYDENYEGRKCNILENLSTCSKKKLELNVENKVEVPTHGNKGFTDGGVRNVVQLKPQFVNIYLAKDIPQNFTFTYKPAKNYPLDLYYLGDMSATMMAHLSVFKTIGADLPTNLTQLTENYKLAFGSFMDKVGMPFYLTAPENFDNPCFTFSDEKCETGYLFKHRLSFTKDVNQFIEMVSNSKTTANLDDLDGALDAIFQVLVCENKIGWSKNSRKIILLPTDSLLHLAGDGLLAGAVLRPNATCLLDNDGNHASPLTYDFPSLGQIDALMKEKKVNIIFAVKNPEKLEYYKILTRDVLKDSGFVGELQEDAKNILELINKGYYNFVRQVSFFVNTTFHENLDVKFFVDCENLGVLNETSMCYNIGERPVDFTVQLTLKGPPTKRNDLLFIEERNINERISLNITYSGFCTCKNLDVGKLDCANGEFRCGTCQCQDEWTGKLCDESCDYKDFSSCKSSINGYICNRNGDCECGKCVCNHPFDGEFCQYQCPTSKDGKICSGPSHGKCIEGTCECTDEYQYEDCSCSKFNTKCKLFEQMDPCSGNGECICNECKCHRGFTGKYCESDKQNNTVCDQYLPTIEAAVINSTGTAVKGAMRITIQEVDEEKRKQVCDNVDCETVVYIGTQRCNLRCCYVNAEELAINSTVHWLVTKQCVMVAGFQVMTIAGAIVLAILLCGVIGIACTKYRIYRLEQEEYRRFQNEARSFNEMNPIYRDPVSRYTNPLRAKND